MKKLIPLLALLSLLAVPASASAAKDKAHSGDVRAELTYNCGAGTPFNCRAMRFSVSRGAGGNSTVLDQQITLSGNRPFGPGNPDGNSVRFANLDSDAEPEIIVDLLTGGAHCCLISFIYDYNGTTYTHISHDWADPGYVLTNIDGGRPEFRSADPRFVDLYTSYVESRLPIQIWNYRGGRLKTVTRKFHNTVRRDRDAALRFYRTVRHAKGNVRGALAAYQADNYLLSRRTAARGWRVLRGLRNRHIVSTRYLRSLQRKLRQFGYAR